MLADPFTSTGRFLMDVMFLAAMSDIRIMRTQTRHINTFFIISERTNIKDTQAMFYELGILPNYSEVFILEATYFNT